MTKKLNDDDDSILSMVAKLDTPLNESALKPLFDYSGRVRWGEISGPIEPQLDLLRLLDSMKEDLEEKIEEKVEAIFHYKGNVDKVEDLPASGNEIGDCYNVNETGANYAWNGTDWDKLSETIDLTPFLTIEAFRTEIENYYTKVQTDETIDAAKTEVNTTITEKETALNSAIDEVRGSFDNYYTKSEVDEKDTALDTKITKNATDIEAINASITEEASLRAQSDSVLDGKISTEEQARALADTNLETAIGNLNTSITEEINGVKERLTGDETLLAQKANNEDVYTKIECDAKYLTEHQDISGKQDVIEDLANIRLKAQNAVQPGDNISELVNDANYLTQHQDISGKVDKELTSANGKALIFNEADGGGAKFEGATRNSFAGVNDMTDPNSLGVQLYNIDKTSKVGPRINLTADRATYSIAKTEVGADYELVIKKDLATKIDKVAELASEDTLGNIVQYVGVDDIYKKGYFYKFIGAPHVTFTPTGEDTTTVVTISLEDFKAFLTAKCEGRSFTAEEVTHGKIGYHNLTDRYSFSADTDDGKFFAVSFPIVELQEAGFVFEPALGPRQGVDFECNLSDNKWKQINVQPIQDISGKADIADVYTKTTTDELLNAKADKSVVANNAGNITSLAIRLNSLEERVANINKTNIEVATAQDGAVTVSDNTKDIIFSGDISQESNITAKSVEIKDTAVDTAVLKINSSDVTLSSTEISGAYNKSTQGNAIASIHSDGYVVIKNCTITPETSYNGIEIGLTTGSAKNILIDNVDFAGNFSNNAISVFQTAEDAVITISNCHFGNVSNVLRLSNTTGAKATYNIINCTVDSWAATPAYSGLILLQDYTSANEEAVVANNLFKPLTINIQNLTKPDGTKLAPVDDLSTIVCSGTQDQIIYMYADRGTPNVRPYNTDFLPVIHIQ